MTEEPLGTARSTRLVTDPPLPADGTGTVVTSTPLAAHVDHVGPAVVPVRNRVQWGPIIAGLICAITLFLALTILGVALGASVLDPNNAGEEVGWWATIWGIVTTVVAFFVGGWVAAKSAAVGGGFSGLMNGLLVGAAGVVLVVWMTASGLGGLFGTLSSNIGDILNAAQGVAQQQGLTPTEVQQETEDVAAQAEQAASQIDPVVAFEAVRNGALGTFFGILLVLAAAAVGGLAGHNSRWDLWEEQVEPTAVTTTRY